MAPHCIFFVRGSTFGGAVGLVEHQKGVRSVTSLFTPTAHSSHVDKTVSWGPQPLCRGRKHHHRQHPHNTHTTHNPGDPDIGVVLVVTLVPNYPAPSVRPVQTVNVVGNQGPEPPLLRHFPYEPLRSLTQVSVLPSIQLRFHCESRTVDEWSPLAAKRHQTGSTFTSANTIPLGLLPLTVSIGSPNAPSKSNLGEDDCATFAAHLAHPHNFAAHPDHGKTLPSGILFIAAVSV